MYKIKVFCDWCSDEFAASELERTFTSHLIDFYGEDKKVWFTNNNDYTHAIILNKAMPKLTIPKENVVGLANEPYEFLGINNNFIEYAKKHIGKYLIGSKHNLPELFIEHYAFMLHCNPGKEILNKPSNHIMSIVLSNKKWAPGHQYRHTLVNHIIQDNLPIDIYGNGSNEYTSNNIKGIFEDIEPYQDYLFTISIENYQSNEYISEKALTPIMYNTVPLYLGAKNILNYCKETILLTGNIIDDMNIIKNVLQNPTHFYKKTYHEENINKLNLFHNIDKLFT
jgi:hypothetical protein